MLDLKKTKATVKLNGYEWTRVITILANHMADLRLEPDGDLKPWAEERLEETYKILKKLDKQIDAQLPATY